MKLSDFFILIITIFLFCFIIGAIAQCTSYVTGETVLKDIGNAIGEVQQGIEETKE